MQLKHLFLDMDQTLTPSRSMMELEMQVAVGELVGKYDLVIVSGSMIEQMKKQIPEAIITQCHLLCQNGNRAYAPGGEELWAHELSDVEKDEIRAHIARLAIEHNIALTRDDHIEDRGCQISFSPVGINADIEVKAAYDPDKTRRATMLARTPLVSQTVEVVIAGSTTFDYYKQGFNKGRNVRALIERLGWDEKQALYVGDALVPGGNDETVVGVIATHAVRDHHEALTFVQSLVSSSS